MGNNAGLGNAFTVAVGISIAACGARTEGPTDRDAATDGAVQDAGDPDAPSQDPPACDAPVIYDRGLCSTAPDVGFCILEDRLADAEAAAPTLRCGAALPPCDASEVSCRYGPDPWNCTAADVDGYNTTICTLWEAGMATEVRPIPLD